MKNRVKSLTGKQYEVARRIAAGEKIREISRDLSIPEATIYGWQKRSDFREYLEAINRESRSGNLERIRYAQDLALSRTIAILENCIVEQ